MPILTGAVVALLLSTTALGALAFYDFTDPRPSGALTAEASVHAASAALSAAGTLDSDLDGAEDAVENFLAGSDPLTWNTSGSRLPDGWLFRHRYDPRDPSIEARPAATPPASALPAVYANRWPARFTPTLWEVYSHGRPANWTEANHGPFDNGIDPSAWDSNGDGIPDGWLLHYGVDPLGNVSDAALAGVGGLTVREAFEHDADPTKLDSDGDGLTDREELLGPLDPRTGKRFPPSAPGAFSTGGSGVCDGYLVAHGLDPSQPRNGYADLARSGATTLQKFDWSHGRFGKDACATGKGLDPTVQSTAKGPIPDGWLLRYGLDPLDASVPLQATQSSGQPGDPPLQTAAAGHAPLAEITLTVLDEYRHGRPSDWSEPAAGPWWGGTDPKHNDTDRDGLSDAIELRGAYAHVATDVGPGAVERPVRIVSDPTQADSDGDALADIEEAVTHGTDPLRRDTDMDGLPDAVEVEGKFGLDPSRADTAGDFLRDGARLGLLESRARRYAAGDFLYEYPGEPGVARSVADWACQTAGAEQALGTLVEGGAPCAQALGPSGLATLFGPGGNLNARHGDDGKPLPNVLNPDIDGDGLLNGWEAEPETYRHSPFDVDLAPRSATDPLNAETDGDRLPDGWEALHGEVRFDRPLRYYNLDPSLWDSDSDGGSDAGDDPDGDSIEWVSYVQQGSATVARKTPEPFPNLPEWREKTDPNVADSNGDGLGDGWKVFWGKVYPNLGVDALGLHHPPLGPAGLEMPALRPRTDTDQSGVVLWEKPYRRFVLSLDGREEMEQLYDEEFVQTFAKVKVPGLDGSVTERDVHEVSGTIRFGFRQAHDAGTNPYLEDTSGDGVPDWWALFYSQLAPGTPAESRCSATLGLDPLVHYTAEDSLPTGSGLSIRQAYEHGTNPLCKDTDLDGLSDGFEVGAGLEPLDPSDAENILGDTDTDGDGLTNAEEMVGVWHGHLGRALRTDPASPDTDGDGLLDGGTVTLDPADSGGQRWVKLYRDLGVAYSPADAGKLSFVGEADDGILTSPLNPDDSGTGVPAGWLVAQGRDAKQPGGDLQAQYRARMPVWWDPALHGPWWGGLNADDGEADVEAVLSDPDPDGDGLRDQDGNGDPFEDPMPFANSYNTPASVDWDAYPGAWAGALAGDARDAAGRRLVAQDYLDPKEEGAGSVYFVRPPSSPPMASTCLQDLQMLDAAGTPAARLVKGTLMQLRGRVVVCDSASQHNGKGFPGLTVEVRLGSPPQAFGAGFTKADEAGTAADEAGTFLFPLNVSSQQRVEIPAGALLRATPSGAVDWSPDPSKVAPGFSKMLVQTYAAPSNATLGRPALASTTDDIDVTVEAMSRLQITAPGSLTTGPSFKVKYRLTDSSGTPLRDDVQFTWLGQKVPGPRPDAQGRGEVTLTAPHSAAGGKTLAAVSVPQDGRFVHGAERSLLDILLLNPVNVEIDPLPDRVDAGQTLDVRGKVSPIQSARGVEGLPVAIQLFGAPQAVRVEVDTIAGGSFHGRLTVPTSLAGGDYHLLVQAAQGASTVAGQASEGIAVRSLPSFVNVRSTDVLQGTPLEVSGRLLDPDARPVAGARVAIKLSTLEQMATTDDAGRFRATLAGDLPVRPALQTLSFAGDALHAPATHRTERAVLANTTLAIQGGTLARGAALDLPVKLATSGGDPVRGAVVLVSWGNETPAQVVTDAQGRGVFHRDGKAADPLGTVLVRARYAGSRDGGAAESRAVAAWVVATGAELRLPSGPFEAGQPIPPGVLRDAGTHKPLANARVALVTDAGNQSVATTDAAGRFQLLGDVDPTDGPRRVRVTASFAGDATYKALSNTTTLLLRTPTRLEVAASPFLVVERTTIAAVQVRGLDGTAVDGGLVNITLDGAMVGSAEVVDGLARVPLLIAGSQKAGPRTLTVAYLGSGGYAPASVEHPAVVKQPVVLSLESRPARPGQVTTVQVLARSGEQPLPFTQVSLQVEGLPGGLVATTDEDGVATFRIEQPLDGARMSARFDGAVQLSPAQAAGALQPAAQAAVSQTAVQWLTVATAAAFAVLSALTLIVYRLRRSPLAPVLRNARRILGAHGPDAAQILKAYQALQDAAIGYGFLEHAAGTPRGLEAAIAPHLPASARGSLGRLMGLFEVARYGTQAIGPQHRQAALDAFRAIGRALQAEAGLTWWQRARPLGVPA